MPDQDISRCGRSSAAVSKVKRSSRGIAAATAAVTVLRSKRTIAPAAGALRSQHEHARRRAILSVGRQFWLTGCRIPAHKVTGLQDARSGNEAKSLEECGTCSECSVGTFKVITKSSNALPLCIADKECPPPRLSAANKKTATEKDPRLKHGITGGRFGGLAPTVCALESALPWGWIRARMSNVSMWDLRICSGPL